SRAVHASGSRERSRGGQRALAIHAGPNVLAAAQRAARRQRNLVRRRLLSRADRESEDRAVCLDATGYFRFCDGQIVAGQVISKDFAADCISVLALLKRTLRPGPLPDEAPFSAAKARSASCWSSPAKWANGFKLATTSH